MDTQKGSSSYALKANNSSMTVYNIYYNCNITFMNTLMLKLITSSPTAQSPKLLDQLRNKRSESHDALCLTALPTPHDLACEAVIAFGARDVLRSLVRRQLGRLPSFHSNSTAFRDALQSARP